MPTRSCGRKHKSARPQQEGFSLVEMLVVLAIIALVTTLVAPQVLGYMGSARTDAAKAQIRNISSALELYFIDNGAYPSNEDGLAALSAAPANAASWRGPYMKDAGTLADPWGNAYIYQKEGEAFVVRSLGRDSKPDGEGLDADISN